MAAERKAARSLSLGARREAAQPRGCLRSASLGPRSCRVVHFELDDDGRVKEEVTSKRFAMSPLPSPLASSLSSPPPSLSALSSSLPSVAAPPGADQPRPEPRSESTDCPPEKSSQISGNAQAGVGGEGEVTCDDDGASVSSSLASRERCGECSARFGSGMGGGFSPYDESPVCGECAEAKGFSELPQWEALHAWG